MFSTIKTVLSKIFHFQISHREISQQMGPPPEKKKTKLAAASSYVKKKAPKIVAQQVVAAETSSRKVTKKLAPTKKTARNSAGGKQPRVQLQKKIPEVVNPALDALKKLHDDRVAEGRQYWDSLSKVAKKAIFKGAAYGLPGEPVYPVIDRKWIPTLPPPPKSLTRLETPGTRGPVGSEQIECGLCGQVLRDAFDAFDHCLLHNQTHPMKCILPKRLVGEGKWDILAGKHVYKGPERVWNDRASLLEAGQSLGQVDDDVGEYLSCGFWAGTRATMNAHVNRKHFLADQPMTMQALALLVPFMYHTIRTPIPAVPEHPYYIWLEKIFSIF